MEDKDKNCIQQEILREYPGTDPEIDIDWDIIEISFKAGMETGNQKAYEIGVSDGKVEGVAEGIREVVEWVNANALGTHDAAFSILIKKWQAFKKERGI